MSEKKPELVEGSGWRREDAEAVWRLHNHCCAVLGHRDVPIATVVRRLRLLGAILQASANNAFGDDPWQGGMDVADDFWRRRASGERGEADDA